MTKQVYCRCGGVMALVRYMDARCAHTALIEDYEPGDDYDPLNDVYDDFQIEEGDELWVRDNGGDTIGLCCQACDCRVDWGDEAEALKDGRIVLRDVAKETES